MPEQTYPPYEAGALTVPRQLLRWLDINPQSGSLQRTMTYITLPAFAQSVSTWNGVSDIVFSFNCESPNNFILKQFAAVTGTNYAFVISYRVGTKVTRYLLWDAVGSKLGFTIPAYTGQIILKNCRFEIWNTSQGKASQSTTEQFYTSVRGGFDYRWASDVPLVSPDTVNTNFLNVVTGAAPVITINYLLAYQNIPIGGFVIGATYNYALGNGNSVTLVDDTSATNSRVGTGSFVAALSKYYIITINSHPTNVSIIGVGTPYLALALPLTFPTTSVSTTN